MSILMDTQTYDQGLAEGKTKGFWNGVMIGSLGTLVLIGASVYFMRNANDMTAAPQKSAPKTEQVSPMSQAPAQARTTVALRP